MSFCCGCSNYIMQNLNILTYGEGFVNGKIITGVVVASIDENNDRSTYKHMINGLIFFCRDNVFTTDVSITLLG